MQPEGKNAQHSGISSSQAPLRRLFLNLSPSLPAVVAFPAAPSDSPTLAYPSDPAYLPVESSYAPDAAPAPGAEDAPDAALDSDAAEETHDGTQQPEQPEDEQQLPRQIHIQQHLKLHFHNQGRFLLESSVLKEGLQPSHRLFIKVWEKVVLEEKMDIIMRDHVSDSRKCFKLRSLDLLFF